MAQFIIVLNIFSWIPNDSEPIRSGWNNTSDGFICSSFNVNVLPSGKEYVLSIVELISSS